MFYLKMQSRLHRVRTLASTARLGHISLTPRGPSCPATAPKRAVSFQRSAFRVPGFRDAEVFNPM